MTRQLRTLTTVIEFSPNHVEAYYNRGVAYSNEG